MSREITDLWKFKSEFIKNLILLRSLHRSAPLAHRLLFPSFFSWFFSSLFCSGGLSFSLLLSLWILWSDTSCDCRQVDIKPRIAHFSWLVYCHLSWSRCQLRFTGQDRHCLAYVWLWDGSFFSTNLSYKFPEFLQMSKSWGTNIQTSTNSNKNEKAFHCWFLEHWNRQKSLTHIWQRFSCLLDKWISKISKNSFFHSGFLK